jgi:hypothetical protein
MTEHRQPPQSWSGATRGWLVWVVALALFPGGVQGQDRPEVNYLVPPALQAGKAQEVTLHGVQLQEVTSLLADIPLAATCLERRPTQVRFRVTPARDAWVGIHQLRALTRYTVSAPRLFVLDELPVAQQQGDNHSREAAQPIVLPASVAGHTRAGKVDYYRFRLDVPAALTLEVIAARLGTGPENKLGGDETGRLITIDPVLRILDSTGRELAVLDDTPGLTCDVRGRYRFDRAGDYYAAVHDVQYQGGPEHQYILRIGDFPDVAVCYPPGGPADPIRTPLHFFATNSERSGGSCPAEIYTSAQRLDGVRWVSAVDSVSGLRSLAIPHPVGHLPEVDASEPLAQPNPARRVSPPITCNGRLQAPGEVDGYSLDLRKGQKLQISIFARTVGSSIWPAVRVLGVDGRTVAATVEEGTQVPNIAATDPRLDPPPLVFEAAANGHYVVQVERRLGKAGPAAVYRLEIVPFAGSFALQATTDYLVVPRGGTGIFTLDVKRDRYTGPLDLMVEGTLPNVQATLGRVPGPSATHALVAFTAPDDMPETAGWFSVAARAVIGGHEITEAVDLTSLYDAPGGLRPTQGHFYFLRPLPQVVRHRIALKVTEPVPFTLTWPEAPVTVQAGAIATLPVRCHRAIGFADQVSLRVEGLPGASAAEAPAIAKKAEHVQVQLRVAGDVTPGRYSLALVGEAIVAGHRHTNATSLLVLDVKPK